MRHVRDRNDMWTCKVCAVMKCREVMWCVQCLDMRMDTWEWRTDSSLEFFSNSVVWYPQHRQACLEKIRRCLDVLSPQLSPFLVCNYALIDLPLTISLPLFPCMICTYIYSYIFTYLSLFFFFCIFYLYSMISLSVRNNYIIKYHISPHHIISCHNTSYYTAQ